MNTYNQYFNDSWEYLEGYHNPTLACRRVKFEGFPGKHTLDMSIKPRINKAGWPNYIHAVWNVLTIGNREHFLDIHTDGRGRQIISTAGKVLS